MDIYHRHEESDTTSPVQFSVANAVEPGTFKPGDMPALTTPGISFFMSIFGSGMSILNPNNSSMLSIGLSFFIMIIASLNLVLDFDFIEEGAEQGAPKYMEWYGAFGLLVTLIWLYLAILRLLAQLQSRRN